MRKFRWMEVEHKTGKDTGHSLSLLEMLDGDAVQFWASVNLYPTPDWKYQFVAWRADRKQLLKCEPDADSVEEAKKEIMKYMKKSKIITKKDIVEHA